MFWIAQDIANSFKFRTIINRLVNAEFHMNLGIIPEVLEKIPTETIINDGEKFGAGKLFRSLISICMIFL